MSHAQFTPKDWSHFLHRVSIFSELEETALIEVAQKLKPLALPRGAIVYRASDPGDALYIIRSGRVRVVKENDGGPEKVLNYLGRGDTLGETTLLTGSQRTVTVKVDSNANFLVLYKRDFEEFLTKNPAASFYLSRLLSKRLLVAAESSLSERNPEILGLFSSLSEPNHVVFIANLGIALTEQIRRKTLILCLGPYGDTVAKSLGMPVIPASAKSLSVESFNNPKSLERMIHAHPSGLQIISLSEERFSGPHFRAIPAFVALLRETYDYVVVDVHGFKDSALQPEARREIARAFLDECDSLYEVRSETEISSSTEEIFEEDQEVKRIVLGQAGAGELQASFVVPWNDFTTSAFVRGGRPYLTGHSGEATQRSLERIARHVGKLQVGFAMGSGAAYGYTLVGILKVFEREKIPIDFISGTSMGALLGSFYASGKSAEEVEAISNTITKTWLRRNIMADLNLPWPHGGLLMGHTISKFLRSILGEVEFKDMPIPFACAATDIVSGDAIVMREGKVWQGVRASLSLPFIFQPYKMENRFLVDGGLVNPVPTSIIASMGADVLISVNLTSKVSEKKVAQRLLGMFPLKTPGIFNILFKMIYTMQYQIASSRTDLSHIMIRPDTKNFSWTDFHKARQIIPLGVEAAEENLTKIKSRLPFFSDYCRVTYRK